MTKLKALGAAAILSTALAVPAFAQDVEVVGPRSYVAPAGAEWNYRAAYNGPVDEAYDGPVYVAPRSWDAWKHVDDYGFTGRDRSRPGGWDPYLNGGSGN